ncbi:Hypothetical protein IALB_0281 [Ignavibacterium album JCM 16511]|uniref:DUF2779 domain-containing protein n=1 Tax=Ignavibacterium album (strain DSM 19864 / JCM 16511 / NBRC 101810 / Mat9-16) TaxID=945713 RepID=I0AG86_IGNAJ|nr:DUF2779 domain-containing protein [Ignavibacterium album]AFH47993.1 Hypothetical protein IALB_0281 [Ignavibacterium album JCM 16511]
MGSHLLSKSSFIRGIQCEKHLFLYKYHYYEMDELSEMQKAVFKRGTDVGKLAQQLFPGGIDLSPESHTDYDEAIIKTKESLKSGKKIIYEAAFQFNDVLSVADILINDNTGLEIFEVKSSTSVTEVYLMDAALQYWVIAKSGYTIKNFSIVYINNQYVRKGELDLKQLFVVESVLDRILPLQKWVEENVSRLKKVLMQNKIPDIDIGEHCYVPYLCGFYYYCRKHIPENSVFDLSGVHLSKKYEMYRSGIISLKEVTDEINLPKNAQIQLDVFRNGKNLIDVDAIKSFLSAINYPLYFMDFETFQPAIPMFDNSRPYMQIPFQFSLHYKENKNSQLKHFEFLAEANNDPRISFIENLIKDTESEGDILVYNKNFEVTRLKEIAEAFPHYKKQIEIIIGRIKDLIIPFQKKYYYTNEMKGSYSIKYVLPALVPELSYENLPVNEGGLASLTFESLFGESDTEIIKEKRNQLLEYCKLDTFAMVKILEKLESIL